jgi:hypothetical protein
VLSAYSCRRSFIKDLWIFSWDSNRESKSYFILIERRMILDQEVSGPCRGRGRGYASSGIRANFSSVYFERRR